MSDRAQQPQTSAGSATVVEPPPPAQAADAPVYHLQLQPRVRVTFDASVVDNEHLGRKKSNKCCIFHKKREFGESSSESGEDSSDDDGDDGRARRPQHKHHRKCEHTGRPHDHKADDDNHKAHQSE